MSAPFPPQSPPPSSAPPPSAPPPPGGQPPPPPGGQPPLPTAPEPQSTAKMLAIVAAVVAAAMALAGGIYAITRPDTSESISSDSVTTETPTDSSETPESAPAETVPAETEPVETVPAETDPATTEAPIDTEPDVDDDLTTIGELLAWTSFAEDPIDVTSQQAEIDRLIVERQVEAVAHPTRVSTICAGVPVNAAIEFDIIWEFAGETVQTESFAAAPPGVGSCIDNNGEPLAAGSYQVLAVNSDLSEIGFATTFVVGASEITQSFINNTDTDICEVGVAPVDTAYYELFVVDGGSLAPGELLEIDIAAVAQDLSARSCDGDAIGETSFSPDGFGTQDLAP